MRTTLPSLRGFRIAASEAWVALPLDADAPDGWPQPLADQLGLQEEAARNRFVSEAVLMRPALVADPHLSVAVAVPEAASGAIAATMSLDLLTGDPEHPADLDSFYALVVPDTRPWLHVYEQVVERTEVPAGPALVVRETVARRRLPGLPRYPEEHVVWTVFPPGCADALQLTLATDHLHLGDDLAVSARECAESLVALYGQDR